MYAVALFIVSVGYFSLHEYMKVSPPSTRVLASSSCNPSQLPFGVQSGQPLYIGCYGILNKPVSTAVYGTNALIDTFDKTSSFSEFSRDYTTNSLVGNTDQSVFWMHNNEWYIDSMGRTAILKPTRQYSFTEGKLTIELDADFASNQRGNALRPGFLITTNKQLDTTASNISSSIQGSTNDYHIHCTLNHTTGTETCSMNTKDTKTTKGNPLTLCVPDNTNKSCFDRIRWELTSRSITTYMNGRRLATHTYTTPLSEEYLTRALDIYFTFESTSIEDLLTRFTGDRIAINPEVITTAAKLTATPTKPPVVTPTKPVASAEASIQFAGKGFARVPHASYYNAPKGWTIETWFKNESSDDSTKLLLTKGDTKTTENIPYFLGMESNIIFVGTRNDSRNYIITYDLDEYNVDTNVWHHVSATFDPRTRELIMYLDGLAVVKGSIYSYSSKDNMQPLYIGKDGNEHFWIGKINDLRIWDTPRSAVEIRNTYLNTLTKPPSSLIGNWRFDEGKGTMAFDSSSKAEHMTIIKGVWTYDTHMR